MKKVKSKDRIGDKYGSLTIRSVSVNDKGRSIAVCECSCGNKNYTVRVDALLNKHKPRTHCGCNKPKPKHLGKKILTGNINTSYEVVGFIGNSTYKIRFGNGYEKEVETSQINSKWEIYNTTAPVIFGEGYTGVGNFTSKSHPRLNQLWINMLKRCYDTSYTEYYLYGGQGTTVCEEWKDFQKFAEWGEKHVQKGFHIEKDILQHGVSCKVYGPHTCTTVPCGINIFVTSSRDRIGKNKYTGVHTLENGMYRARCSDLKGNMYTIGYSTSEEDCFELYKNEKIRLAKVLANKHKENLDKRVYEYLKNFDKYILDLTVNPSNVNGRGV